MDVRNKLRLALGSVKDHASIGKAMIFRRHHLSASIEIAVVRATAHDNAPINEQSIRQLLLLVSNSPRSVAFLARRVSHRLHKTQDRIVALKTLLLVHRLLRGGATNLEQELLKNYLCGNFRMNLHLLPRNSENSLSFLHNYAAFIEERLGWVINQDGKLEPVVSHGSKFQIYEEKSKGPTFLLLHRCQALLDRIMDCLPIEMTRTDFITRVALISILRESFQVYMRLCEGITALVDCCFDYKEPERALALEIYRRASSQSYKLTDFFKNCKKIIGGDGLDYPSVRIITVDCVSAIEESVSCLETLESMPLLNDSPSSIAAVKKPTTMAPADTSREADMGEEVMEEPILRVLDSPFSCKLETKISREWVVFDKEETQGPCLFIAGSVNQSPGFVDDLQIDNLESRQGESDSYYNPFVDHMDCEDGNFMRG